MTADVNNVISSALGANPQTNMVEGEKLFPIAIRWPERLRKQREVDPGYPGEHHQ